MKNEDIYVARKKYKKYLEEVKELMCLKNELEELKSNPIVKRYLELIPVDNKEILNEKTMIAYSFGLYNFHNESKENKIYIYMGAYNVDNSYDSRTDIKVIDREWEQADYLLYKNIDSSLDTISIKPKCREQFENKYTVLKFNNTLNIEKKYNDLQQYYFSQLLSIDLRKKSTVLTMLRNRCKNGNMEPLERL